MSSPAKSRLLTVHAEIRRWAEERRARPAAARSTHSDDYIGMIRLDFPGYSGEDSLAQISWDEWFEDFDDRNLALLVEDEIADGEQSNFHKLVHRERAPNRFEEISRGTRRETGSGEASGKKPGNHTPNTTRAPGGASETARPGLRGQAKTAEPSRSSRPKAA